MIGFLFDNRTSIGHFQIRHGRIWCRIINFQFLAAVDPLLTGLRSGSRRRARRVIAVDDFRAAAYAHAAETDAHENAANNHTGDAFPRSGIADGAASSLIPLHESSPNSRYL